MDDLTFQRLFAECERIVEWLHKRVPFPDSDRDDLMQEMALRLLEADEGTDNYRLTGAMWAALDWLRRTHHSNMHCQLMTIADLRGLIDSGRCRRVWC
jgi:hypothetical protein